MQYERQDAGVVVSLPKNSQEYIISKFRIDEVEQISCNEQRLCIGILSKSLTEGIEIKKNSLLGLFVLKTKANIEIKYETQTKKKQAPSKISKKNTKGRFFKQV